MSAGTSIYRSPSFRDEARLLAGQRHVLQMVAEAAPLRDVLTALVRIIEEQSHQGVLASILLMDPDGLHLRHGAAPSLPDAYTQAIDGITIGPAVGSCGTAAFRGESVIVTDIASDPLWTNFAELALKHDLRACWSVPIFSGSNEVLGTFALYCRTPCAPDEQDQQLVRLLAQTAGIAIERRNADTALRETRARLDAALSAGELGTFVWEVDADRLYGDKNFEALFQIALDKTGAAPLASFVAAIHPDDRERTLALVRRTLETGCDYEAEYRIVTGERERWVIARGKVERDAGGQVVRFPGVLLDITDRQKAEQSRRELADRYDRQSRLFEGIASTTLDFIYLFDLQGRFLYANRRLLDVWGRELDDIIGKTCLDLGYAQWHHDMHMREIADVIRTKQSIVGEVPFQSPLTGIFGIYEYIFTPVIDPNGEVEMIAGTTRDVTIRKRAEEAHRENADRLTLATEIAELGIFAWDVRADTVTWENDRIYAMFGRTRDEGTINAAQFAAEIVHRDDLADFERAMRETLEDDARFHFHGRFHRKDRSVGWLELMGRLERDAEGAPTRMLGAVRDVTSRKEAEEERERLLESERAARAEADAANQAKDRFLAVLSHEFRTPLSPVVMTIPSLEADPDLPPQFREPLGIVRRNIDLEVKLIDDLLDLSRVSTGKLRLQLQPVRLHELIQFAGSNVLGDGVQRRLSVRYQLEAKDDRLLGDPARLQQVFWNLLRNSVKFTPDGGEIIVRTFNEGDELLVVEVQDTGIGIEASTLDRIFDAFEQGDRRSCGQFGGLGLGLAIAKALVEMHQGTISAYSAGLNRGSTFTVTLQTHSHEQMTEPDCPAAPSTTMTETRSRILLVEDHTDTAHVLSKILHLDGFEVTTAMSVSAAMELIDQRPFDLLISDLGLPDGTGYDLMRHVRDRTNIPGIALSGYGMDEDLRKSRDAGFADHVVKPVNGHNLRAVINTVLSTRT